MRLLNIKFSLLMITSFIMTACISTGPKFIVEDEFGSQFPERSNVPEITKLSQKELMKKGMLRIGTISAREEYKICYQGSDCSSEKKVSDPLNDMLEQARKKGADYVSVDYHNNHSSHQVSKNGKCLNSTTRNVTSSEQVCTYYLYGSCQQYSYVTKTRTVNECLNWEKVYGTAHTVGSMITLWRKGDDTKKALELQTFMKKNAGKIALDVYEGKTALFKKALQLGLRPDDITYRNLLEYLPYNSPQRKKIENLPIMWIYMKFNKSIFERAIYKNHYEIVRLGFEFGLSPDREVQMGGTRSIEEAIMKESKDSKMIAILNNATK